MSPIYQENAADVYKPFFESPFLQMRLGKPGLWLGQAAKLFPLTNPVQQRALENLLSGLSPDGKTRLVPEAANPDRVAAWRMVITLPPVANRAWSVRPRKIRLAIERAFAKAVNRALKQLEKGVSEPSQRAAAAGLFAVFRTNAAQDLSPQLQATVLFPNLGIQPSGKVTTFSPEKLMGLESGLRTFLERDISPWLGKLNKWWGVTWGNSDYPTIAGHIMGAKELEVWSGRNEQGVRTRPDPWHIAAWRYWAAHVRAGVNTEDVWDFCKDPATAVIKKAQTSYYEYVAQEPYCEQRGRRVLRATSPPPPMLSTYSETADSLRISPVFRVNAADTYGAFFQAPMAQEMLSKMGHWQGRAVKLLRLKNPVQSSVVDNLVNGMTPDGCRSLVPRSGDPNRLAGWRVTITAPQYFNWTWGAFPKTVRLRLERAFAQAVQTTLKRLEREMTGDNASPPRWDKSGVVAVFRHNAASDHSPQLQATALFFNLGLRKDGSGITFSTEQVMRLETSLKEHFHEQLLSRTDKQASLLSDSDWNTYAYHLGGFLGGLSTHGRASRLDREQWSGRNHEGMLSKWLPCCFAEWRESAQVYAEYAGRTWQHDSELPKTRSISAVEFVQGWYRRMRQRAHLAEPSLDAVPVPLSKQEPTNQQAAEEESPGHEAERDEIFHGH